MNSSQKEFYVKYLKYNNNNERVWNRAAELLWKNGEK